MPLQAGTSSSRIIGLGVHYFPAYAPELNPPDDLSERRARLTDATRRRRRSQDLLWSCIYASDLPWAR